MEPLPHPESLCHRCGAPPRYIHGARTVFILCPLEPGGRKYLPQPVLACALYRPAPESPARK